MKKLFLFASAAALVATSCSDDLGLKQEQVVEGKGNCTLIATYPLGEGTRTTLENGGTYGKHYVWEDGDAIGVFNAATNDNTNAAFTYTVAKGEESAQFNGDLMALQDGNYYAYYPYYSTAEVVNNTITLNIKANQNYNHLAAQGDWVLNPPTGSFSQNTAPAVAIGSATANNQLEMTFQPVASNFVFPVKSYSPVTITKVTLEVTAAEGQPGTVLGEDGFYYQLLAGDFEVNMTEIVKGYSTYEILTGAPQDNGLMITLNCGRGVTIDSTNPANFWFVVPSGLQLRGATIIAKFYAKGVKQPFVATKTLGTEENVPVTAGMNSVRVIVPESNTPWVFNSTGDFYIQNQAQFLEYAYLVTNGMKAVNQWAEMNQKYPSMTRFSSFAGMVEMAKNETVNSIVYNAAGISWADSKLESIKDAYVPQTINFNPATLAAELKAIGLDLNSTNVPIYYQNIYKQFIANEGAIPSIGAGFDRTNVQNLTISGASVNVQLNGLKVNGNGMFAYSFGDTKSATTLQNITLNDVAVKVGANQSVYYLLSNGNDNNSFNNVKVTGNSTVSGKTTNAVSAIFESDYASYYDYSNTTSVNTKTNVSNVTTTVPYFAANLYLNYQNSDNTTMAYDFTPVGHQVANFNNIYLQYNGNRQGFGSILNVTGEGMAVTLMEKVYANNKTTPYSVVSKAGSISYWTGRSNNTTGWLAEGSAERLASIVQNSLTETFKSSYVLNLMGNYAGENAAVPAYWWTSSETNTITVDGGKTGITVANVHIDGTKDGKTFAGSVNLSLLGQASKVTNLTVKDINISYKLAAKHSLLVAAISAYPAAKSSAYVSGYTANIGGGASLQWNAAGGLYTVVTQSSVGFISGSFSGEATSLPKDCKFGQAAGNLQFTTKATPDGVTNPLGASCPNPFGIFDLYVTSPSQGSTAYFTLTNFPAGYNGEESIINATVAEGSAITAQNNLIMNQVNGKTTVSAQWLSSQDEETEEWYYAWYQDLTKPVTPPAN